MENLFLQASAQGGGMSFIIMMVAIFAIMYFLMIRPQQKKQKEITKFQNALKVGDSIVTGGGVHGIVKKVNLENGTINIEIANDVIITVEKTSIYRDFASQPKGQK